MFSVVTGLGFAGWTGIAAIGAILGALAAWQNHRHTLRAEDDETSARRDATPPNVGPVRSRQASAPVQDSRPVPSMQRSQDSGPDDTDLSPHEAYRAMIDKRAKDFARARGSLVLKIVHHDVDEYIDTDTAIEAIDLIRQAPDNAPIDIVLHTPGGIASATQQILHALKHHPGRKTAFVPYRAKSAGTMIALACDEIVMGTSAVLGPIDPQYSWMPAPILAALTEHKSADRVSDEMIILSKMAKQAVEEARRFSCDYINDAHKKDGTCALTNDLIGGRAQSRLSHPAARGGGVRPERVDRHARGLLRHLPAAAEGRSGADRVDVQQPERGGGRRARRPGLPLGTARGWPEAHKPC